LLEAYPQECHLIDQRSIGIAMLREALKLCHEAGNLIQEGAVLAKMANMLIGLGQDAEAEHCAHVAIQVLEAYPFYMLAWQAWTCLHLGMWNDAEALADIVLRDAGMSTPSRLMALVTVGRLRTRRGDPDADTVLDEALSLSEHMHNIDRLGPLHAARAEAAWQKGDREATLSEARAVYDLTFTHARMPRRSRGDRRSSRKNRELPRPI
jgi:hypothetical protein